MDEAGAAAGGATDLTQQFVEGEGLGADSVEGYVAFGGGGFNGEARDIVNVDRLKPVIDASRNEEDGEAAKEPGDVVDEHVFATEDNGGPDDGVGQSGSVDVVLDLSLASEVGEGRGSIGVGDADVDDAPDSGGDGGVDEVTGVAGGCVVVDVASGESDPVGIVEGVGSSQAFG